MSTTIRHDKEQLLRPSFFSALPVYLHKKAVTKVEPLQGQGFLHSYYLGPLDWDVWFSPFDERSPFPPTLYTGANHGALK